MTRKQARQKIAEFLKTNPHVTYREVAEKLNWGLSTIGNIAREYGVTRYHKHLAEDDLRSLEG